MIDYKLYFFVGAHVITMVLCESFLNFVLLWYLMLLNDEEGAEQVTYGGSSQHRL